MVVVVPKDTKITEFAACLSSHSKQWCRLPEQPSSSEESKGGNSMETIRLHIRDGASVLNNGSHDGVVNDNDLPCSRGQRA
ncbi:hypothetical protein GQ457_13G011090 [Hibiscus cannabinus]